MGLDTTSGGRGGRGAPEPATGGGWMTFRPIDQEPDGCWVACLASITGIPLAEFPKPPVGDGKDGWSSESSCAYHNGAMAVLHRHGWTIAVLGTRVPVEGYAVASGPSPRLEGSWHAVVWKDGAPLFDPHPSRSFLQGEPGEFELVVRIRPFEKAAA